MFTPTHRSYDHCAECETEVSTDDLYRAIIGILLDGSDFVYDDERWLCPECWDGDCARRGVQSLDDYAQAISDL